MTFDYNKEDKTPMSLVLENGISAKGEFIDLRIATETLPKGKQWYQIRHRDDDGAEPASLKRGCVVVNFFGTFICDPIDGINDGDEPEIKEWRLLSDEKADGIKTSRTLIEIKDMVDEIMECDSLVDRTEFDTVRCNIGGGTLWICELEQLKRSFDIKAVIAEGDNIALLIRNY